MTEKRALYLTHCRLNAEFCCGVCGGNLCLEYGYVFCTDLGFHYLPNGLGGSPVCDDCVKAVAGDGVLNERHAANTGPGSQQFIEDGVAKFNNRLAAAPRLRDEILRRVSGRVEEDLHARREAFDKWKASIEK